MNDGANNGGNMSESPMLAQIMGDYPELAGNKVWQDWKRETEAAATREDPRSFDPALDRTFMSGLTAADRAEVLARTPRAHALWCRYMNG